MKNRRKFLTTSAKLAGGLLAGVSVLGANSLFATSNSAQGLKGSNSLKNEANLQNLTKNSQGEKMQSITLNNGVKMPILGYGVYQITDLKECQRCVEDAISVGYRSIDTAQAYFNEEAVGAAIKTAIKGNIKREDLFITTKLWISDVSEAKALKAFEASLKKLGLEYLDLYLIHQPFNDTYGAWRAMSKLYKEGRIKAIGVSNFYPDRIIDFSINNEVKPALNQIECNPLHQQYEAQAVLNELGIAMQSWASFGEGKNNMFSNPLLAEIGKKYDKTVAQVILRWLIQRNIIVIPKTTRKERMIENISVFDFALSDEDMAKIKSLDSKTSLFFDHRDPEKVRWLNNYKS